MERDIRQTALYLEAEALYRNLRRPGSGSISDAAEIHVSPDGSAAVFTATIVDELEGALPTQICQIDLTSGHCKVLASGGRADRCPKIAPDGQHVAFLSDRHAKGDYQLYILDRSSGGLTRSLPVRGWVEYLHWSPDGTRVLLGVAGHGADVSGGQGAISSGQLAGDTPSWMPEVATGDESYRWRSAWIHELATNRVRQVNRADQNVWEAVWCGNDAVVAVVSDGPGEGRWYSASLEIIGMSGDRRELYSPMDQTGPKDQIGWPAASPCGKQVVVVTAICSDRWIVAGDLLLIDTASREVRRIDTLGVDVTYTEWRSNRHLLVAGHRGAETVVGLYDTETAKFAEIWRSREISSGSRYVAVAGYGAPGHFALIGESFTRAPEVAVVEDGEYHTIRSFDLGYQEQLASIAAIQYLSWRAPDGLEIQGWLLSPRGAGPHPLVMNIHGGPVWHWHPLWLGRPRYVPLCMLIQRGYAIFLPNPRGSSGRGQEFARRVLGAMGGADAGDFLSGLDHLVAEGIADPRRLGVTGVSYGGFMSAWLVTQDTRFAAAVPVAPVTNQVTQHLLSNIPEFVRLFLADSFANAGGNYYRYSPIMHAEHVTTPTLSICGALDRCTPPAEATQFHNALLEHGVESVLLTYPEEGHGIHKLPAALDFAARVTGWFEQHLEP